jgi:hypothetical protein
VSEGARPLGPVGDGRTSTEVHIDEIVSRMVAGRWLTGVSHQELAREWGLSVSRVEELATEANRIIRRFARAAGTRETLQAQLVLTVDAVRVAALERTRKRVIRGRGGEPSVEIDEPDPDFRSALEALKLKAAVLGLHAPLPPAQWFEDPDRLAEIRLLAEPGRRTNPPPDPDDVSEQD